MSDLTELFAELYSLLTENNSEPFVTYCIISPEDEGEIEGTKLGLNRKYWTEWGDAKKLEVILHEFAHIDEESYHSDHDFAFYTRLQDLANKVYEIQEVVEELLDISFSFADLRRYLIDSVNEYTIEDSMSITQTCLYLSHTLPPVEESLGASA